MDNWHKNESPFGRWHGGGQQVNLPVLLLTWFLVSGTWNEDGRWVDEVEW